MNRLTQTETDEHGNKKSRCRLPDHAGRECGADFPCSAYCRHIQDMIDKLAEYENKEERGRLYVCINTANEWIKSSERQPEGKEPFVATDGEGHYCIGYANWLFGRPEQTGIYLPARHGLGIEVIFWMPLPKFETEKVA